MVLRSNKPHFQVTAGLLWREGRLLITKRPEGSHLAGFWEFPGGKREKGESLEECLEREIREELDMGIRAEKLLFTVDHEYETRLISLHIFHCTCLEGQPSNLEGQETRWVHPDDLQEYSFPPPDLKIIQLLSKESMPTGRDFNTHS